LLAGSDDSTILTKRFWKSALPICGVVADVAPGGEQIVKPVSQLEDESSEAVATATMSRDKQVLWMRIVLLKSAIVWSVSES
jgi:hypothetical protein